MDWQLGQLISFVLTIALTEESKSFLVGIQISDDKVSNDYCAVLVAEERTLGVNKNIIVERIFRFVGNGIVDDVLGDR